MTKKQKALNRKVEWNRAIAEGRVLKSQGGLSFTMFTSAMDAQQAVQRILVAGMQAEIVDPSLADTSYL